MERLTKLWNEHYYCNKEGYFCEKQKRNPLDEDCCCECDILKKMHDKLGKYEDMEDQLEKVYGECEWLIEIAIKHIVDIEKYGADIGNPLKSILMTNESAEKWEKWKKLYEQGKLIELPCPFCGSENLSKGSRMFDFGEDIHIQCMECGAKIQICMEYGWDELRKRWNRRTPNE